MKIAFVADYISRRNGGITEVMYALARQMMAQRHQVVLFGGNDAGAQDDCAGAGVIGRTASVTWSRGLRIAPELKKMIADFQPDIIHIHGIWQYGEIAASGLQIPYVISPHGMLDPWALHNSGWKKKIFSLLFEKRIFRNAALIHALCDSEKDDIERFSPGKRISVIPNGIDLPAENTPLPTCDGKKELLYLGRLHPKKGADLLIRAFGMLNSDQWRLVIAGWEQGGYGDELKKIASEYPQADIVFPGALFGEAKASAFRRCSAFILPSFSEGLPMAVLEAWSYKKPALLTDFCHLPEGFAAGAALRIEPEAGALKKSLQEFFALADSAMSYMGEKAGQLIRENFVWRHIAEELLKCYTEIRKEP